LVPGHCFDFPAFQLGIEIPNSLIDFVMMAVPIGVLRGLQMRIGYKISLALIFFLGGFVGIIGFIRISIAYENFNISNLGWWLGLQLAFGVLCCCFPTFKPLFTNSTFLSGLRSRYASLMRGTSASGSKNTPLPESLVPKTNAGYDRFHNSSKNVGNEDWVLARSHATIGHSDSYDAKTDFPMNSINVERTVDVV